MADTKKVDQKSMLGREGVIFSERIAKEMKSYKLYENYTLTPGKVRSIMVIGDTSKSHMEADSWVATNNKPFWRLHNLRTYRSIPLFIQRPA